MTQILPEVPAEASSAADLLSSTVEAYTISSRYINCIKKPSPTVTNVQKELKSLKLILSALARAVKDGEWQFSLKARESAISAIADTERYYEILKELQSKLEKEFPNVGVLAKQMSLTWPISEQQTQSIVNVLRDHVRIFGEGVSVDDLWAEAEILKTVQFLGQEKKDHMIAESLDWLSPKKNDMWLKQRNILSKRVGGTGEWLLEHKLFKEWLESPSPPILWCSGNPGVGKTVMSSIVADHLKSICTSDQAACAVFFCDYRIQADQTALCLLGSIARQLIQARPSGFKALEELHDRIMSRFAEPTIPDFEALIHASCDNLASAYVIIDALDELLPQHREIILPILHALQRKHCKILVTSRPYAQDIGSAFENQNKLAIEATDADVRQIVKTTLEEAEHLREVMKDDPELREEVFSSITTAAHGMILFSVLQLERLKILHSKDQIRNTIATTPKDVFDIYQQTMDRIMSRDLSTIELAVRSLGWLSLAKRPLKVVELQHALAMGFRDIKDRKHNHEPGELVDPEVLLNICEGLISIDPTTQDIHVVHYTAQEFLSQNSHTLFPDIPAQIAGTCLNYLLLDDFAAGPRMGGESLDRHLEKFPLLEYAAVYWGDHLRGPLELQYLDLILEFIKDDKKLCASVQVCNLREPEFFRWCNIFGWNPTGFGPLQCAASQGLDATIQTLLREGCDASGNDETFKTPVHWAAWRGHCSSLKLLLDSGVDIHIASKDGFGLLETAVDQNRESSARFLLERGHDVNRQGFGDGTALLTAALMGHEGMVNLLLDKDADLHMENQFGESALFKAALRGSEKIVQILLDRGASVNQANTCGNTALHGATFAGRCNIVERLLDAGSDVNKKTTSGATPLHLAANQGYVEIVKLLISRGAKIEAKTSDERSKPRPLIGEIGRCIPRMVKLDVCGIGISALNEATYHGHAAIVKYLLDQGADADSTDVDGYSPLSQAIESARHSKLLSHRLSLDSARAAANETVSILLAHGVDVDKLSNSKFSALHSAADVGNLEIIQLLSRHGANLSTKEYCGRTPLHTAAHGGHSGVVEWFLSQGVDAQHKDNDGCTAFHLAAASGDVETMKLLLDSDLGFDIEEKDGKGVTPLLRTIWSTESEAFQFLLDRGADISREISEIPGMHAATIAVIHDAVEILKLVINRGVKLDLLPDGSTLLHLAAKNDRLKVLPVLVENGLSLSQGSRSGHTPLHVAALEGQYDVVEWLLDHGAIIDATDKTNGTALGLAANAGHEDIVDLLCKRGANVNQVWDDGLSILEDTLKRKFVEIARKLVTHGAKKPGETQLETVFKDALGRSDCPMLRLLIELDDESFLLKNTTFVTTPFHAAASRGDVEFAKFLITKGFDIGAKTSRDDSPMSRAILEKNLPMIEFLLENGGASIAEQNDLVEFALDRFDEATAILIIRKGVKFDREEVLYQAVSDSDRHNLVKVILDEADISREKMNLDHAIQAALTRYDEEMCDLPFDRGADVNSRRYDGTTALHLTEDVERARSLLARGANLEARDHGSRTPLLQYKTLELTKFFVSQGADLRVRDRQGWTALHYAAARFQSTRAKKLSEVEDGEIVEFLLSQGMDVNIVDKHGSTPLHIACSALDLATARVLLARGAKVNARAADGDLPIHAVVTESRHYRPTDMRIARTIDNSIDSELPQLLDLLLQYGADINAPGAHGHTALHRAAEHDRPASVGGWLLDRGAHTETQDHCGNTPLLHVYTQDNTYTRDDEAEFVEVLLKRGADIRQHSQRHQHELECALDRSDLALAGALLSHGVSTDMKHERAKQISLHDSARDAPHLLKFLLDQGHFDIEERDSRGYTPLGRALDDQASDSVRILLEHGATCEDVGPCPCGKPGHTATALRIAAGNGDVESLRLLLDAGANPNARNHNNNTALTFAAEYGQAEALAILLDVPGIEINAVDNDGDSALLCAVHGKNANTTKLLLARPDVDRSIKNKLGLTAEELAQRDRLQRIIRLFKDEDENELYSDAGSDSLVYVPRRRRRRYSPVRIYPRRVSPRRPRRRYPRRSTYYED